MPNFHDRFVCFHTHDHYLIGQLLESKASVFVIINHTVAVAFQTGDFTRGNDNPHIFRKINR